MSNEMEAYASFMDRTGERVSKIAEKMFSAAQPGAVFGEPVRVGDFTLITASEVASGGGFGSGMGFGPPPARRRQGQAAETPQGERQAPTGGGGMGGGGGASGRPVAVIEIGPEGVKIRPVVDVTKIALAAITAWGAMGLTMRAMRKMGKG